MLLRFAMGLLLSVLLLGGCGSSVEDEAEELFRACIEAGGGTIGDVVPFVEDGQLLVVQGPVEASIELFEECLESANEQLAGEIKTMRLIMKDGQIYKNTLP